MGPIRRGAVDIILMLVAVTSIVAAQPADSAQPDQDAFTWLREKVGLVNGKARQPVHTLDLKWNENSLSDCMLSVEVQVKDGMWV